MTSNPERATNEWRERRSVLAASTAAFTLLFGVWMMLGILSRPIREEFRLTDAQVNWLISAAILAGSLPRLGFGMLADSIGGRRVYLGLLVGCAAPAYLFCFATTYAQLLACVLLFGLAGNSFTAGVSWNSAWSPPESRGLALGILGAGNVGAAATKLLVLLVPTALTVVPTPGLLGGWLPGGWRVVPASYAVGLLAMAAVVARATPAADRAPGVGRPLARRVAPLRHARVWRHGLDYVVAFGAYVALAAWLPKFYQDACGLTLRDAALATALFIFPASLLRPVGGWLADRHGARVVTRAAFAAMAAALLALCVPDGAHLGFAYRPGPVAVAALLVVVGCGMGIGKASVFKAVADDFPGDVGAVGGLVGTLGALGGFALPPLFGALGERTGLPRLAFAAPLALTLASLAWLQAAALLLRAEEGRAALAGADAPAG